MKGRYHGASMGVYGAILPGAARLARLPVGLSKQARQRLAVIDWYQSHGRNARLTCRHFGICPDTFYRWKCRFNTHNLRSLEDRPSRPRRRRQPTWSVELAEAVLRLRQEYPRWGKDKLVLLLHQEGWQVSTSMVGRILCRLKERGVLVEPPRTAVSARKRPYLRPYAVRKPKEYVVKQPGDMVQVDTLDLRLLPGVVLKHFSARDVVSRWDVLEVHTQATAAAAARFLDTLQERMPFPVKAIQVDGGSEFQATFETECQRRGIPLFVLPPRSPKLNGHVERAHRTHTEEFYQVIDLPDTIPELNRLLQHWERVYNTIRPHQALAYLTPAAFLQQLDTSHLIRKEEVYGR